MRRAEIRNHLRWIQVLLLVQVILYLISLINRRIHVDGAVLADPTYWLTQYGFPRSFALEGWQTAEEHLYFTHKLFIYLGAAAIKILGWSKESLNSVSLISFVALLVVWYVLFHHLLSHQRLIRLWFFWFILLVNKHFFEHSFVYRPEVAVAYATSTCFLFLLWHLQSSKIRTLISASILAGVAMGLHLNGISTIAAGFLTLIINQRWKEAIIFATISLSGWAYHFIDVQSWSDFLMWKQQFMNMQDIKPHHKTISHYITKVFFEYKRFFHSGYEISFSLLLLFSVYHGLRTKIHQVNFGIKSLMAFTTFGSIALALISHGKNTNYLIIFSPFYFFLIAYSLPKLLGIKKLISLTLLLVYFIFQSFHNVDLALNKENREADYAILANHLEPNTKILAPVYAVFWAIPRYRFQSFISYQFREAHGDFQFTRENFLKDLERFKIEAIIFDQEWWNRLGKELMNDGLWPSDQFHLQQHLETPQPYWLFVRKEKLGR